MIPNITIKQTSLSLFLAVSVCWGSLNAQEVVNVDSLKKYPPQPITNVVKFNPLPILWGPIPLTAEYRILREIPIGMQQSVQIGVSYLGKNPFVAISEATSGGGLSYNNPVTRITTRGFRLQLSHRFYFSDNITPKGAYFGPHVSYSQAYFSDKYLTNYQIHIRATHFNVNMLLGYQIIVWDKFSIDFFTGLGYKKNLWQENSAANGVYQTINMDDIPLYSLPVKFTLGVNFGIAFE